MSERTTIADSFGTTESFIRANLDSLEAKAASEVVAPGASDAHWVLGHIVYWRSQLTGMLGAEPLWAADAYPEFRGVVKGTRPDTLGRDFAELLDDFALVTDRLTSAFAKADDDSEALPTARFLALHEAYHAGQLGVFRRMAGLSGAVGQ